MEVALIALFGQILDVAVTAITKKPEYAPHLTPTLVTIVGALSQAAEETPEQTAARRRAAEAIFAKQATPIGPTP